MKLLLAFGLVLVSTVAQAQVLPTWSGRKIIVENPTAVQWFIGHGWGSGVGPTYTIQAGATAVYQWPTDAATLTFIPSVGIAGGVTSFTPSTTDEDIHVQFWTDTAANIQMIECFESVNVSFWFWAGMWQSFAVFTLGFVLKVVRQIGKTSPEL
jgi:hypothetical protein